MYTPTTTHFIIIYTPYAEFAVLFRALTLTKNQAFMTTKVFTACTASFHHLVRRNSTILNVNLLKALFRQVGLRILVSYTEPLLHLLFKIHILIFVVAGIYDFKRAPAIVAHYQILLLFNLLLLGILAVLLHEHLMK